MPRRTIALGVVLIALGIASYIATSFNSWTALIPTFLGIFIALCGLIAMKNSKAGIHIALGFALLGILGTSMNVVKIGELIAGDAERPIAIVASTVTFGLLIGYVTIAIRSFINARR